MLKSYLFHIIFQYPHFYLNNVSYFICSGNHPKPISFNNFALMGALFRKGFTLCMTNFHRILITFWSNESYAFLSLGCKRPIAEKKFNEW